MKLLDLNTPIQKLSDDVPKWLASIPARIISIPVMLVVLIAGVGSTGRFVVGESGLLDPPGSTVPVADGLRLLSGSVASVVVAFLIYVCFVRFIERRAVTELTLRHLLPDLVSGLVLGAALLAGSVGLIALAGGFSIDGTNDIGGAIGLFAVLGLTAGVIEELIFRGLAFRIIEESLGTWLSLALTTLFFGAIHLGNPNASITAALSIGLEAGLLLGALFALTRRLWIVIGVHMAWNTMQGAFFGIDVSGNRGDLGYLKSELTGATWWSGGEFGAEGSIFSVVLCVLVALPIMAMLGRSGRVVAPRWKKTADAPENADV